MDGPPLRILTIKRPWSWCVADGAKNPENRTGNGWGYRGLVAIHHGKGWSKRGANDERVKCHLTRQAQPTEYPFEMQHHDDCTASFGSDGETPCDCEVEHPITPAYWSGGLAGMITTVVELVDVHPAAGCCKPWGEDSYVDSKGELRTDVVHLTLANPVQLPTPVGWRGNLGLQVPDPDTYEQIMNQYKQVTR